MQNKKEYKSRHIYDGVFFLDSEDVSDGFQFFCIGDKDYIRIEEQKHEKRLHKELLKYGIKIEFDKIIPHEKYYIFSNIFL